MSDKQSLRERIANRLFGDIIDARIQAATVSIRVDDSSGWDPLGGGYGPADRPWAERADDLEDALEAWRKHFLVRRIVALTRSYVVGSGITISSRDEQVNEFVQAFWNHPKNHIDRRLGQMCDELTRAGEVFPALFTNRVDGMSYIRFVPAARIYQIETDPEDHENELRYGELTDNVEPKWWNGPDHPRAFARVRGGTGGHLEPVMLHFAVNRPIGAVRGEGDLVPILPWARRYAEWLKDRVRLNRQRTRQGMLDVQIADDSMVQQKRQQLRRTNPVEAGIYVHGPGETTTMHSLKIDADDVKEDGRALRLAISAGANVGLHYLGEGESVNYATAREMGEPTACFYTERQAELCGFLEDLVEAAWRRRAALGLAEWPHDLQLTVSVTEVARADNESLAKAALTAVQALREMREAGWIDNTTAIRLAFKFAGEPLSEADINRILEEREG